MLPENLEPKILIVDDDKDLRRIYSRYLAAEGFKVLEADNGEQVVLEFSDEKLDIILLDIRMSVASGMILAPQLRYFHPDAKVIVFSCYAKDLQKQMIKDADDYFDKAEGCKALLSKIRTLIDPQHA